jgi:hypothetical protein
MLNQNCKPQIFTSPVKSGAGELTLLRQDSLEVSPSCRTTSMAAVRRRGIVVSQTSARRREEAGGCGILTCTRLRASSASNCGRTAARGGGGGRKKRGGWLSVCSGKKKRGGGGGCQKGSTKISNTTNVGDVPIGALHVGVRTVVPDQIPDLQRRRYDSMAATAA